MLAAFVQLCIVAGGILGIFAVFALIGEQIDRADRRRRIQRLRDRRRYLDSLEPKRWTS